MGLNGLTCDDRQQLQDFGFPCQKLQHACQNNITVAPLEVEEVPSKEAGHEEGPPLPPPVPPPKEPEVVFDESRDKIEEDQQVSIFKDLVLPVEEDNHDTRYKPMDPSMEEHYRAGHHPKRMDCPVRQQSSGPVVRHFSQPTRFDKFGTMHVDLTGPLPEKSVRCHRHVLIRAHRLKQDERRILLPWAVPIKLKSDAPREILRVIYMLSNIGALRGMFGLQLVRVQSDNGGEFINEELRRGCQQGGICMSQIPPYQPQSIHLTVVDMVESVTRRTLFVGIHF